MSHVSHGAIVPDSAWPCPVVRVASARAPIPLRSFPLADEVSLEEIAVGDIVELTFETTYSPDTQMVESYRVISITELSPDTELVFNGQASEASGDRD